MNFAKRLGLEPLSREAERRLILYANLKLASIGCPAAPIGEESEFQEMAHELLVQHRETSRLLAGRLCPADQRIQDFLNQYLEGTGCSVQLPAPTFVLDRHGLARVLSLPPNRDFFCSEIISSYRVQQGILHNPRSDRRTTAGIFHVAEGGLPVPDDKLSVPKPVFAQLVRHALAPPPEWLRLPFTSTQASQAECFVSLLLRPLVCPEVPGFTPEKTMEIRFLAPGGLVCNLDFVESIFGNAGNPWLPENDAGLDSDHWTGHTGCVILAPHLTGLTKKSLGLPAWDDATERQRRDGMCWKSFDERYNSGQPFKITGRDERGVIVTVIADNYFGYCKKEVKTQISFSANLFGLCEEEHAGGALVYPSFDLGEEFSGHLHVRRMGHTFSEVTSKYGEIMELRPEGYAIDKRHPDIVYVSEDARFDLHAQRVSWQHQGKDQSIKLLKGKTYVRPSGYKVRLDKPAGSRAWRLIGTLAEGLVCHKPCTVSGGGKSEISKSISDAIIQGPVFIADIKREFELVAKLLKRDYSDRFRDKSKVDHRSVLSPERSLGSVIKLLTPSPREYTDEYNAWLGSIPQYVKELVFVVKRFYMPDWGEHWRDHFSVDVINGVPGNELKLDNRPLVANYLRVGFEQDGSWRVFGLRKDFHPADKLSLEDDITASVTVPKAALDHLPGSVQPLSVKFVKNCEYRLFQRPDDAIHRGYDKQTESDFSAPGNFFSNYEPLTVAQAKELIEDSMGFDLFTEPMRRLIRGVAETGQPAYFVCSAQPRIVEGKPSKNPRYLQTRPDLVNPRDYYLAETGTRLHRRIPLKAPVHLPVGAVLPGRRNNPPQPIERIRSLAVFNPVHYMELPELFMEFICSMTGKSPSTTGAGSEGALTKGPFNAVLPIIDLNNALVSYLLSGYHGYVTAAAYVGPHFRVGHDVSFLVPEVWSRMTDEEREPAFLIENGFLEKCNDFDHSGTQVPASRLGYRITRRFVRTFFGRIFNHPHAVFDEKMLRPELQDLDVFVEGIENIVATQKRVAESYFSDGSIALACPPVKALLHVMARGEFEGKDLNHPELRGLFTRAHLESSKWYEERLASKQDFDLNLWRRHVACLEQFLAKPHYAAEAHRLGIAARMQKAKSMLAAVSSADYRKRLHGTLGRQPSFYPPKS